MSAVPLYHKSESLDGQQLKLMSALALEAEGSKSGLTNIYRLKELTGTSRARVGEIFESLVRDGRVNGQIAGGWVTYRLLFRAAKPIDIPRWALKLLAGANPSACRLYYSLRQFVHSVDGVCFPSDRTLAGMMDRCRRTFQRSCKTLQEMGLFVVTRQSWQRVPRFVWAKFKKIPLGRMVKLWVMNRADDPSRSRTLSPTRLEVCRGVIDALINEVALLSGKPHALVQIDRIPEPMRTAVDLRPAAAQEGLRRHGLWRSLSALGFTEGSARYITGVFPGSKILEALRKTNESRRCQDSKRYLFGLLRRR